MFKTKKLCLLVAATGLTVGAYASVAAALAQCIPGSDPTFLFSTTVKTKTCSVFISPHQRKSTAQFNQLPNTITYLYSVSYEDGVAGGSGSAFPVDSTGKGLKNTAGSLCPIAGDRTIDGAQGIQKNCTINAAQVFIGISTT